MPSLKKTTAKLSPRPLITDRRILLIEAKVLLEMFGEAGTQDGYNNSDLAPYFEELKKQVAHVEQLLKE
ncbi:MAG: hypothetical protein EOO38_23610 [Cytophagaceae bacterium]|nr:MAG: hypothetical protein EOO38_23610 [Cytophagaceae bacterium]